VHQQPHRSALVLQGPAPPVRVRLRGWWEMDPFRRVPPTPEPGRPAPESGPAPPRPAVASRAPVDPVPGREPPGAGDGAGGSTGYRAAPW
jgi:hypothetical protein